MKNYALNKHVVMELELNSFADAHTEMATGSIERRRLGASQIRFRRGSEKETSLRRKSSQGSQPKAVILLTEVSWF